MNFLDKMGGSWNISLFHYRSHGADFGRVLVGIQLPPQAKNGGPGSRGGASRT